MNETIYACPKCGAPLARHTTSCPNCGYERPPIAQQRRPMPALTNQPAIASAVLATFGIVVPFALSIAAIVMSVRASRLFRREPHLGGRALAAIGLWLGIAGLAAWGYVAFKIATR